MVDNILGRDGDGPCLSVFDSWVSMWQNPDYVSTFGAVSGRRGLIGCPFWSGYLVDFMLGRIRELSAVLKKIVDKLAGSSSYNLVSSYKVAYK